MHELGLTETIVAIASDHAHGAKVYRITLELGQLTAIMPDAIQFCFDICAEGTPLEGATLEIIERAGLGRCCACGQHLELDEPYGICDCGSTQIDIIQGEELIIKELEVEAQCA